MKKIINLILVFILSLSLNSCFGVYDTCVTTQDDIYTETYADIVRSDVDVNIVISRGVPYYYNGSILYYLYNGFYYYPFYYNNYWYIRAYRRPFPYTHYRPYFRPGRYDYRFSYGYRPHSNWYYDSRYHRGYTDRPQDNRPPVNYPNNGNMNDRPVRPNTQSTPNIPNTRSVPDRSISSPSQPNIGRYRYNGNATRSVSPNTSTRGVSRPSISTQMQSSSGSRGVSGTAGTRGGGRR